MARVDTGCVDVHSFSPSIASNQFQALRPMANKYEHLKVTDDLIVRTMARRYDQHLKGDHTIGPWRVNFNDPDAAPWLRLLIQQCGTFARVLDAIAQKNALDREDHAIRTDLDAISKCILTPPTITRKMLTLIYGH